MVAVFDPLRRPQKGRNEVDLPAAPREQVSAAVRVAARYPAETVAGLARPSVASLVAVALAKRRDSALLALPRGYFLYESSSKPPATHLLLRGKAARPGPEVAPGVPAVLVSSQPSFPSPGEHTSLRRLTLARWLADAAHPLTARVIVNRVWQYHFGEGLVRTPSDFGVTGEPPTHPELLEWLTGWFVHEGWSLKKLHSLILTSNTYRMSKAWRPQYGSEDPENRLLWRMHPRRLEVEAIRDSVLAVSGRLNPKMYGPSVYPPVPRAALESHSDPDKIWRASREEEASRRTIYVFIKRSLVLPLLEVLDLCDTARSSARRLITTVAPQALSLFNGDFVNEQAHYFAARLEQEAGGEFAKQVERAYALALCRLPSKSERVTVNQFFKDETANALRESRNKSQPVSAAEAKHRALAQVCRVIFNLNEFLYAD
jgi:hypothetical protein